MKKADEVRNQLFFGNCLDVLKDMESNIVSAVITDGPYGLSSCEPAEVMECLKAWTEGKKYNHNKTGFMGRSWDGWVVGPEVWKEIMRVLKPGGHILSFYGTRTYDLGVLAMRIAGCEVRDKIDYYCEQTSALAWVHGQGFPKSLDISKAMEKTIVDAIEKQGIEFTGWEDET